MLARVLPAGFMRSDLRVLGAAPIPASEARFGTGERYVIVFGSNLSDRNVVALYLDDRGIRRVLIGCNNAADVLVTRNGFPTFFPLYDLKP